MNDLWEDMQIMGITDKMKNARNGQVWHKLVEKAPPCKKLQSYSRQTIVQLQSANGCRGTTNKRLQSHSRKTVVQPQPKKVVEPQPKNGCRATAKKWLQSHSWQMAEESELANCCRTTSSKWLQSHSWQMVVEPQPANGIILLRSCYSEGQRYIVQHH